MNKPNNKTTRKIQSIMLLVAIFAAAFIYVDLRADDNSPQLQTIVVLAEKNLKIGDSSTVHSGNIINNSPDINPNKHETRIGKSVKILAKVFGYDVAVSNDSKVSHVIAESLSTGKNTVITNKEKLQDNVLPITFPTLSACEQISGDDIKLRNSTSTAEIQPGAYNNIELGKSNNVTFNEGVYDINTITMGHGTTVRFNGPTTLRIREGTIRMPIGGSFNPENISPIIIEYCGSSLINVEKNINACILAPHAQLTLKGQGKTFRGQFFASEISIGKGNNIYLNTCFETETPPPPPTLSVICAGEPKTGEINEEITWTATPSGGTGVYTYEWTGDATGTTPVVFSAYTATSTKTAVITVKSGKQTASNSCNVKITEETPPEECTKDIWECTQWSECSSDGKKVRTCALSFDCPNAETPSPETEMSCEIPTEPPYGGGGNGGDGSGQIQQPKKELPQDEKKEECTEPDQWTCSEWSICTTNNKQTRACHKTEFNCPVKQPDEPTTIRECKYLQKPNELAETSGEPYYLKFLPEFILNLL